MLDPPPKNDGVKGLIEAGAEIAGGAIGGAIGLVGGPIGALAGGAGGVVAGKALAGVGNEIAARFLGPREKTRIGAVLAFAADEIKRRTDGGEKIRSDDFFTEKPGKRSKASEVAENIILKAQREAEEAKIKYLGHMLAGIAFDPTVSAAMAHQMVKAMEALTYRQLQLLKLGVHCEGFGLRSTSYRGHPTFSVDLIQLLFEYLDLYVRGFVSFGGEAAFGPSDVIPGKIKVQGMGGHIYNYAKLSEIPSSELVPIANVLK